MAKYRYATPDNDRYFGVINNDTKETIPNEEANPQWVEFTEWNMAGGVPDPFFDTPEEEQQYNDMLSINAIYDSMVGVDRQLLKLIVAMYQVGRNNNLWTRADFEAIDGTIVDKIQALRASLSELENLESN